jgi:hypothetical protein
MKIDQETYSGNHFKKFFFIEYGHDGWVSKESSFDANFKKSSYLTNKMHLEKLQARML